MTKRYKKFFILMMTFAVVFGVLRYSKKQPQAADQLTEQFTTHKLVLDDRAFFNA